MSLSSTQLVSLTSRWFIRPGCEEAADAALRQLAHDVELNESDTLTYLVHAPYRGEGRLQSLPPAEPRSVLFFETYRSADAFLRHVDGPVFTAFVERHGELFVASNGKPFTFVDFLQTRAGFVRSAEAVTDAMQEDDTINVHPSVMFEIMARDQANLKQFYSDVFGWRYNSGSNDFAYIRFPRQRVALLGGIGQAASGQAGSNAGTNFYLRVADLQDAIGRVVENGGSSLLGPTSVDGYTFAMVKDPEGNAIGLVKPF
ncbi:VOC family protein [Burkholderia sp. MSMB1589WGS]|uniref:VOC family protein n=1 Tax=Burkholderia sp. MSMB1589WGS TaxID=1636425 RepID=UPI0009EEDA84|nr:VOC family protein [Burkholderia sp. MSMB1589WGS]